MAYLWTVEAKVAERRHMMVGKKLVSGIGGHKIVKAIVEASSEGEAKELFEDKIKWTGLEFMSYIKIGYENTSVLIIESKRA